MLLPVVLLALISAQSAFTVSDLFVTHFALVLPLVALAGGLAIGTLWTARPCHLMPFNVALAILGVLGLLTWAGVDARNTLAYHRILTRSGGYSSHSDGIYRLAAYLTAQPSATPLVLDWGMDAQLQFLSEGRLEPIEVFGYASIDHPDSSFAACVAPFLNEPNCLYIAHVPNETVFKGRVAALSALANARGESLHEQARFGLRSGQPLFIVYKISKWLWLFSDCITASTVVAAGDGALSAVVALDLDRGMLDAVAVLEKAAEMTLHLGNLCERLISQHNVCA